MHDAVTTPSRLKRDLATPFSDFAARLRCEAPSLADCGIALFSALLLIISFPNFNLWPLAWVALVPLLLVVAHRARPLSCFWVGWLFGSVFFFGSCHWLTYSIIHFGGFSPWLAYPMLIPGALVLGIFPGAFAAVLAQTIRRWGTAAIFLTPVVWAPLEWARLGVTGQLWNAIGYSQAFQPLLIHAARWGGVYAVGFLIALVNAAIAYAVLKRTRNAVANSVIAILIFCIVPMAIPELGEMWANSSTDAVVIAIQPNVPMDLIKPTAEMEHLRVRHFEMSEAALRNLKDDESPRLIIWPESPMNFTYGTDSQFREQLAQFAKEHHASILLNSQEVAPNDGIYNSAVLINEQGNLVAQYDKIRLLPFGEYVPLPQWLPGAGLIRGIVGDFTPGKNYRLMPVGSVRTGVFICIESAYPSIAREFTREGADVLINISNDGYLGPTAVMRQHLANAVFRAVENNRPLLRVTNTGITAFVTPRGQVSDETQPFRQEIRTWRIARTSSPPSFYAKHGDLFVAGCALLTLLALVLSLRKRSEVGTTA
ncbi:MAG: apolipoprotein N-acyltransferase [Pyrinomonadaceae bacterium]